MTHEAHAPRRAGAGHADHMKTHGHEGRGSPRLSRAEHMAYKKGMKATFGKEAAEDVDVVVPEVVDERDEARKQLSREAALLRERREP